MRWAGRTHPGHVRHRNEDAWGIRPGKGAAVVADGVGGSPGGDHAAVLAVDRVLASLAAGPWPDRDGTVRRNAVHDAHRAISEAAALDPALTGMATTVTAVRWKEGRVEGVHVGDSRAYLVNRTRLTPLTQDQTPAGEALRRGEISREGLREHPRGNLLLQVLGGMPDAPEPELFEVDPLPARAAILLCTDGVEAALPEARVSELVIPILTERDPQASTDRLFDAALAGSAPDNLTAVLLLSAD